MGKRKRSSNDGPSLAQAQSSGVDENSTESVRKATSKRASRHASKKTLEHVPEPTTISTPESEIQKSQPRITSKSTPKSASDPIDANTTFSTIQIITGSYDRILHGFTAKIDFRKFNSQVENENEIEDAIQFADTFLFNAHSSAVRCLALSSITSTAHSSKTDGSSKVLLASGSTDERINLYSLSAHAPSISNEQPAASSSGVSVMKIENPKNREVGSLLHHSSTVTRLCFAKSKLISASEDNTIAISRTRDWTLLTAMRAPVPQAHGRPSGDTAAPGKTPAGVNDFDIDPSAKILISVGRGERCMRLWNLVTGKRANALNFGKDLLHAIGEAKFHSGEGRKVLFEPDGGGFVVAFEYAAAMFNMQLDVVGLAIPSPKTKIHQIKFITWNSTNTLAVSTEDGRIILFDTQSPDMTQKKDHAKGFATFNKVGQVGGPTAGVSNRVKDFEVLTCGPSSDNFIVAAGSDGSVRIWHLEQKEALKESTEGTSQIGRLLGRFDTANRITCVKAFTMLPSPDKVAEGTSTQSIENPVIQSNGHEDLEEEFQGFE